MSQNLPEIHWIILFPRADLGFPAVLGRGLLRCLCLRGLRGLQGQTLGLWLLAQLGMVSEKKNENWKTWGKNWKCWKERENLEKCWKEIGKQWGKTWEKHGQKMENPGKKCRTFGNKNKKKRKILGGWAVWEKERLGIREIDFVQQKQQMFFGNIISSTNHGGMWHFGNKNDKLVPSGPWIFIPRSYETPPWLMVPKMWFYPLRKTTVSGRCFMWTGEGIIRFIILYSHVVPLCLLHYPLIDCFFPYPSITIHPFCIDLNEISPWFLICWQNWYMLHIVNIYYWYI